MRIRPLPEEAYLQLIRTSRRLVPATLWIAGGTVFNVYTREWTEAHVVVAGERIAYVGDVEPVVDEHTLIVDASNRYIVPGYIEPHAHPFQWYNPSSLSDYCLSRGTTTLVSDTQSLAEMLPVEEIEVILDQLSAHPVKQFFWARVDPYQDEKTSYLFTKEGMARLLAHPRVLQGGELAYWQGLLAEDEDVLFGMKHARDLGKRLEGHHPGASLKTLNTAAAAGVTACHESINAREVQNRLRLGMYATLRHSSIRPDLPELIRGLRELGIPFGSRLMLTTDGSPPPTLPRGFTDYIIRVAIQEGVSPEEAYAMATLNPAVYYGLDAEIGGIAPGRLADILLLSAPTEPTPELVIANGRVWAEQGKLLHEPEAVDWPSFSFPSVADRLCEVKEDWFSPILPAGPVPVIQLENAVITRLKWEELPRYEDGRLDLTDHPDLVYITSLNPETRRMTQSVIRGFATQLEGLASTYTVSKNWLVLGREPRAMKRALERVLELRGGIAAVDGGQLCAEVPLEIDGRFTNTDMGELMKIGEAFVSFMRSKEYRHLDPIYSLLFFTATHLPTVRLTEQGLYDLKQQVLLQKSVPMA